MLEWGQVKADQFIQFAIYIIALFLGPFNFRQGRGVSLALGRDDVLLLLVFVDLCKLN